jgi:hypothetical protein
VAIHESYPYQLVQLLRKNGLDVHAPEIVAKTGWSTGELKTAIRETILPASFDIVILLIGVNNQYRGLELKEYEEEFEELLKMAMEFSVTKEKDVFVLSIPDWGVTPFAEGRDRDQIAQEIDEYNKLNRSISKKYGCNYISITAGTRKAATDLSLIAADKLHYSSIEYGRWASLLSRAILKTAY